MKYGIIGPMPEEVAELKKQISESKTVTFGKKEYIVGKLKNRDVVLTCSGIGKVCAGSVATVLISYFDCDIIINTGVGGGIAKELNTLDMVISSGATQHDFDLTIFNYKPGQVPGFPQIIPVEDKYSDIALEAAKEVGAKYNFSAYKGLVVSGDQFVAGAEHRKHIDTTFPDAYVTEMEGAAIAQVAYEMGKHALIIRSISDKANGEADMTFDEMLPFAARNSQEVLLKILEKGL